MRIFFVVVFVLIVTACSGPSLVSKPSSNSLSSQISGSDHRAGFIDLYVGEKDGKVLAKLPKPEQDGVALRMIYTMRLTAGLGSNPVGLDRGWGGNGQIIVFRVLGNKVIIEAQNMTYRATSDNIQEKKAVRESFARSFMATTDIMATSADGEILIDLSAFLKRDGLNLVQYLKDADQGNFNLAKDRTLIDTKAVYAFPDNVEMDVFLTLTSSKPGGEVSATAANGSDVTLIQHHSFVRLPDADYAPLRSDPRAGVIERVYYDYSAGLSDTIERRMARRFRLEKTDPDAALSPVKNPIIFYIDSGAPEPVRSALLDGARWWGQAFESAGYKDAYRAEILPEGAHPLDVRYNVVQWVHRQTRGWSYGGGVSDPRTGEMLKGHVNLGSLRVRQDRMIFEGLAGTGKTNTGEADDPVELALARIRQLAAHEIGHALGFAHNFAASSYGKQSVMDYPAPDVKAVNGTLDFSGSYGVGIGTWDKFTATWLYGDLDGAQREDLVTAAAQNGLVYVADSDGRSVGAGHPRGSVWDNGDDPVQALDDIMDVRRIALDNFDLSRVQDWQPVSDLNKVIVPIYLYHRYQTAAAGKVLGGMSFNYALASDTQTHAKIVPAQKQRRALTAILRTIDPKELDLSNATLSYLTPSLSGFGNREKFGSSALPAFDLTAAAQSAVNMTFGVLFHPRRLARIDEFNRRDAAQFGLAELFETVRVHVSKQAPNTRTGNIVTMMRSRYAYALMDIIGSSASASVRGQAQIALDKLQRSAQGSLLTQDIKRFNTRPVKSVAADTPSKPLPPGSPIGMNGIDVSIAESCWHCEP